MRRSASLFLAALLPMSLLTAGASASPPSPYLEAPDVVTVRADALTRALDQGRISEAEYALHRARSLFRLGAVRAEFGNVHRADPHSATMILRDLALRLRSLSGEERDIGEAILARPTQGGTVDPYVEYTAAEETPIESTNFRIHYVASGPHAATATEAATASTVMEEVWTKEITIMGWREPKADGTLGGGTNKFDVYLGNVGAEGIYGYCANDPGQTTKEQTGYCVLDDDFVEFPPDPAKARKVTAAHEFNHAIQFAYDVAEDSWLFEATATWMEDEVYDDVNDNYQYLSSGQLGRPQTPADVFGPSGEDVFAPYGNFIWMRYLSETFGPDAVEDVWERAAATGVYSLEAIAAMLAVEGATTTPTLNNFADGFADFAARNADPSAFYEEGANYEVASPTKPQKSHLVSTTSATNPAVLGNITNADHLTSRYISFKPGTVGATESLTIAVNMGTRSMQEARVVTRDGGTTEVTKIVPTSGEGNVTLPFAGKDELILVLTNASNRMDCNRGSIYSCEGTPLDENLAYTYSASTTGFVDPGDPGDSPPPPGDTTAPVLTGVKVKPNPVVRGKTAKILFTIDEAAQLKITILKSGRKILSGTVSVDRAGKWFVEWKIGKKMATGKYVVKLKATDAAGNFSTKKATAQII